MYDARKKEFRQISRHEFDLAKAKHFARAVNNMASRDDIGKAVRDFKATMNRFKSIPYVYKGDGLDDFNTYQRPSRSGTGYVAICIGESCNNIYVEEPFAVKALKRKYEQWRKSLCE